MNLIPWRRPKVEVVERGNDQASLIAMQEYVEWLNYQGTFYPFQGTQQSIYNNREDVGTEFASLSSALQKNAVVSACMEARRSHFSEVRLIFRDRRTRDTFTASGLALLESPYGPGSTTANLLSRMIQDADLAGNSYHVSLGDRLAHLRPDWVSIVLGSSIRRANWVPGDPDTVVVAYLYFPGGEHSGNDALTFQPEQIAHFAPIPDPMFRYKGMSLLTSAVRDIQSDLLLTQHLQNFMEHGATPNMVVKFPEISVQNFNEAVETIRRDHEGPGNAHKTLFLTGGAEAQMVGSNLQEADFRAVQGARETRICLAMRVPAVIAGVSEALGGSSLNTGNYQSARRMFADGVLRPAWRNAAISLSRVVKVPGGSELWYDDTDVAFLREDLTERAEVMQMRFTAAKSGIDAGFEPDAIVQAISSDDFSRLLGQHTGLTSVQLQPPADAQPELNGKGTGVIPALNGGTA